MSTPIPYYQRLEDWAYTCENVAESVHLYGTSKDDLAKDIRGVLAELATTRAAHEPLVLCLEICRAALEHHEEISDEHGAAEMHRHLYATMALAIKTLEEHRGAVGAAGDATYWQRISAYQAKYSAR